MVSNETILQVKTPAYIFDLEALRERVRMMRAQLGDEIRLVYAVKANPFLVRTLIPLVDAFEICSPGEEVICRRAGVPGKMMVLSGVNKERENFSQIMDRYGDAPVYTAESEGQLRLLSDLAAEKGLTIRVLPRLSGGSQFGMDEQVLRDAAAHRERYPGLVFAGVHFFTGTQKKPKVIAREIERVDALLCDLRQPEEQSAQNKAAVLSDNDGTQGCAGSKPETDVCSVRRWEDREKCARTDTDHGMLWRELEYGPGLAVRYFTGDTPPDDAATLADLRVQLMAMRFDGRITLEMGRFIAAYCGYYVTRVEDMKTNDGTRYCIVDGGIHQVNYYGSNMGMKIPFTRQLRAPQLAADDTRCQDDLSQNVKISGQDDLSQNAKNSGPDDLSQNTETTGTVEQTSALQPWTVCGSLCTTADVIVRELPLTDLQIHDILVFERTGAYSVTEGVSLFLSRDLPRVYLWEEDGLQLVRDRILTEVFNDGTAD